MSEDNESKIHYINGHEPKKAKGSEGFSFCKYDPESGEHLKNIAGSLDRLEKVVETNLSSLTGLASGRNQIGVGPFFAVVGCLFALLVIMFLYFTGQEAHFNRQGFDVNQKDMHGN